MLNPIDVYRAGKQEKLIQKLQSINIDEMKQIIKKYMPDMTRKMYRCNDSKKLIEYICKRAESLANKGQVF